MMMNKSGIKNMMNSYKSNFELLSLYLQSIISHSYYREPYPGLRIGRIDLKEPYLRFINIDLIILAVMQLYIKYALRIKSDYGKFTISFKMKLETGIINFTLSKSIPFRENGQDLSLTSVYAIIKQLVMLKEEEYNEIEILSIYIRIYQSGMQESSTLNLTDNDISNMIWECFEKNVMMVDLIEARRIGDSQRNYPKNHLTEVKERKKERHPFIVADTETILIDDIHVPYAVGFLVVYPDVNLSSNANIETYFSEDHIILQDLDTFEKRSSKIMKDFINRLVVVVKQNLSIRTVYFHNFSRFDGILLLNHLVKNLNKEYRFKPLIRNGRLYEVSIYRGNKVLLSLKDSLHLLPGSLDSLSKNLCPQLGSKGSIPYDKVRVSNLIHMKKELLDYMKQDILLLGGVMLKAQEIYWEKYKVDIVSKLTLSSLAMQIFRMSYYDSKTFSIHIPNRNSDTFIRRGYYGGHAEVYKPKGKNLYYYDVNSLYPYIMKSYPMPGGNPVWHGNLYDHDLDSLYGFIEAYVECPTTISRPFLPYRENNTLIFPTGKFVGVYYSEELKYARDLGYKIIPLTGYLFEKRKNSPFESFVSDIFERRQEAKRAGNDAMSYIYKTLMNSLYGRFGINPKCTITEICDDDRRDQLLKKTDFIYNEKLSNEYHIVNYWSNPEESPDSDWSPPRISAIQLAAAVTACARIHMYPYISREDCYYTDTDSVVLGSPLPSEEISSTVLGKFKLEHELKKGIFLAPKAYCLWVQDGQIIIKQKGLAKSLVNEEWYESQYSNLTDSKKLTVESNFRIEWDKLNIIKKEISVNLGLKLSNKREPIYENGVWVDTVPKDVTNIAKHDKRLLEYEVMHLKKVNLDKNRIIIDLKSKIDSLTSKERKSLSTEEYSLSKEENIQTKEKYSETKEKYNLISNQSEKNEPMNKTLYDQPPNKKKKKRAKKKKPG